MVRLPRICSHADGWLARLRAVRWAPSAPCLRGGRGCCLAAPPRGEQGSVGGGDQFGGIFRYRPGVSGVVSIWSGGLGAIKFVWRGSVRIRRGDRGRLDPAGLTEASGRLRVMRMNGTPVLRRWYQGSAVSGICRRPLGPISCLRRGRHFGISPLRRPARKSRLLRPSLPVAVSRSDGGELPLSGDVRARAPLCPLPAQGQAAASPPAPRGEMGNGDYAQVSSGGRVERAVREGGRCLAIARLSRRGASRPARRRRLRPRSAGTGLAARWVLASAWRAAYPQTHA